MKTRTPLLVLALFSMTAYGVSSVMFNDMSYEMAASVGFSLDEMTEVKTAFTITQILGLLLTPLLLRRWGSKKGLSAALVAGITANLGLYTLGANPWVFVVAWLCNGFALSTLLAVINLLVLQRFDARIAPVIIAAMLIFSTLLPLGAYPWLVSEVLERFNWTVFSALLTWLLFSGLVIAALFPLQSLEITPRAKSGFSVYLFVVSAISLIIFLLMRGDYYNWLDSVLYSELTVMAAILSLAAVYLLVRQKARATSASMQLHGKLKTNVFMYNAFIAGFAVSASSSLFANFLGQVLHYNSLNSGYVQLPAFYAMIAGMLLSVLVYIYKRPLSDAIVPIGVMIILFSVYSFSQLPSNVAPGSLWMPIFLRGFGVGLLNISVSISVLMYFKVDQRIEGICNFYLFRTMGSLIGGAFFSQVIQEHSAQASTEIGRSLSGTSSSYAFYEQALGNTIATHGSLSSASIEISQISSLISEQATTLALNNSLIVFILSIFSLAPVLLIGKKLAAKQS